MSKPNKVARWQGARSRRRLSQRQITPQAAPSFGQPQPISRLGRVGQPYRAYLRNIGAQAVRGAPLRDTHVARARGHCALVVQPPRRPRPRQLQAAEVRRRAAHTARLLSGPRRRAAARAERDCRLLDRVERHGLPAQRVAQAHAANHWHCWCCALSGRGL